MKEHAVGQGTKPWIRLDSKRKILDSRNCLQREKSCTLIVGHRLFQRYRSNPELTAWVLMSAYAGCGHRGTSHSRFRSRNILRIKEAQLK